MTEYYTYTKIINIAKEITNNVNTKKELGRGAFWSYYIAQAILNPKKKIEKKTINTPNKFGGNLIKRNVSQTKYLEIAKYLVWFVNKKKEIPAYIEYKNKRMFSPQVYTDLLANVLVYYNKKGKLPNEMVADAGKFIKPQPVQLHDYLTNEGCDEIGQCTPYYCACNSLQQCFYRLTGIWVSEHDIAEWAGTTSDGTDHEGIGTAIAQFNRKYNKNVKIAWYNFSELSWSKILDMIKKGAVFFHLLYRQKYGHYEGIKWVSDDLEILNSLGDKCGSQSYCGYIEYRSKSEQQSYINGISQKSVAWLYNG